MPDVQEAKGELCGLPHEQTRQQESAAHQTDKQNSCQRQRPRSCSRYLIPSRTHAECKHGTTQQDRIQLDQAGAHFGWCA